MPTDKPSKPPARDDGNKRLNEDVERFRESVRDWEARIALLEASEPAALGVLVRICQNELAAMRPDGVRRPVGFLRWPLAHLIDLPLPKRDR